MTIAVGRDWAYYAMSLTIMVVLALAANTSFGGLPVLASLLARNNYLPHLYALRDDRQVFASGIWTLAILSGALLAFLTSFDEAVFASFLSGPGLITLPKAIFDSVDAFVGEQTPFDDQTVVVIRVKDVTKRK